MNENQKTDLEGRRNNSVSQTSQLKALMDQVKLKDPKGYADLVHYDEETGLYDKKGLEEYILPDAINKAERENVDLCYAKIDVDHGKFINDSYGHVVADYVFKEVGRRIKANVRSQDNKNFDIRNKDLVGGRVGGDEYDLALYGVSIIQGAQIMDRLRNEFKENPIKTERGDIYVTLSIGVTGYQKDWTAETMRKVADEALYRSKDRGRDETTVSVGQKYMKIMPRAA